MYKYDFRNFGSYAAHTSRCAMNIYKHDLKIGLKPFIFWTAGLAFLLLAGMAKFLGVSGGSGAEMAAVLDKIPKIFLIVLGMGEVDILSLGGYYIVLESYIAVCIVIYGVFLGSNAVARESIDKTYEFIFTKPCTRFYILFNKISAAFTYLTVLCILNIIFSYAAFIILDIDNTIVKEMILIGTANTLIGILFFSLSVFLAAFASRSEKGTGYGYKIFMLTYIASIIYDVFDRAKILKIFLPLKYFKSTDLLEGNLDVFFVLISLVISFVFLALAFWAFEKRDLNTA